MISSKKQLNEFSTPESKIQNLIDIYDLIKEDSKKYRLEGEKSTFYTYYDNIEDAIRWFKIQSLGSLNESYAAFYLNDVLPSDKREFIEHSINTFILLNNEDNLYKVGMVLSVTKNLSNDSTIINIKFLSLNIPENYESHIVEWICI